MEADRRQTRISEISFSEWASYLVAFRKDAMAREAVAKVPTYPDVSRTTGINPRLSPNR